MKRVRINWAIPGLFAMILIITAVAWMQTQSTISPDPAVLSSQCAACHTMDTQVAQWQESSHKTVACTECHADPGVKGWLETQIGLVRMKFRQDEVDLSQIATEVPNQRCIDCHARQMPWVMQDLKPAKLDEQGEPIRPDKSDLLFLPAVAGHDVHLTMEKPLNCTECHTAVSHGPSPDKREERVATMHNVCLDCHAEQKVSLEVRNTVSCSACHLDLAKVAPADHKSSSFRSAHGDAAKTNEASCTECHLNPGLSGQAPHSTLTVATGQQKASLIPVLPAGTITPPADAKDTCAACHGTTMPHPQTWLTSHTQGYKDKPELCASCHGTREQGFNMSFTGNPRTLSTTDPSCTNCHAQPMPHPENYVSEGHQAAAKADPRSCEQCHSASNPANPNGKLSNPQFCADCHLGKYAHADGYVFKHSEVLATYGNNIAAAGCVQCHSTAQGGQNSCASCHGSSVTDTQWHVPGFVATHKNTLAQYGNNQETAGCANCHGVTQAQNTCTACHTNGLTNGKPTEWHPANWWIKHAQTTAPADKQSCNQCHNYVEPSCAKCHTKF